MKPVLYVVFAFFLLFSYCSREKTYTEDIVNGVRVIHNLKPKYDKPDVGLEFVQTIGKLDGENSNYLLHKPYNIAVDDEGYFYVLDSGNNRIQKFNSKGEYILTIGRKGQGPGEFGYLIDIQIINNEIIRVIDSGNMRVSFFDLTGKFIKHVMPAGNIGTAQFCTENNLVLSGLNAEILKPGADLKNIMNKELPLLSVFDINGGFLYEFGKAKKYGNQIMNIKGNVVQYTFDEKGSHYVSYWCRNRIEKYSPDGKLLLRISRELNYPETEVLENRRDPANHFSEAVGIDEKGRIWIQTNKRQLDKSDRLETLKGSDLYLLEVYDTNGILLERIGSPGNWNCYLKKVSKNKLYFMDDAIVYEYRIVDL